MPCLTLQINRTGYIQQHNNKNKKKQEEDHQKSHKLTSVLHSTVHFHWHHKMNKRLEEKHLALKKKGPNNENCQLTNNSHSCTILYRVKWIQLQRIRLHLTILGRWNLRYIKAYLLKRPANIFKTQILTFSQQISVHKPSVCVFFLALFIAASQCASHFSSNLSSVIHNGINTDSEKKNSDELIFTNLIRIS